VIPSRAFIAFSSIGSLYLSYQGPPTSQKWDKDAFVGTIILNNIDIYWLPNVLPFPPSFDRSKLSHLWIFNSGTIELTKDAFQNFGSLFSFAISNTKILKFDDDAFAPVTKSLMVLALKNASLTDFPAQALNAMPMLASVDLRENQFSEIDLSLFPDVCYLPVSWTLSKNNRLKDLVATDLSKVSMFSFS
jgi:hypothetical protein